MAKRTRDPRVMSKDTAINCKIDKFVVEARWIEPLCLQHKETKKSVLTDFELKLSDRQRVDFIYLEVICKLMPGILFVLTPPLNMKRE